MNNTEKKLDALIDALGFDVEKVTTNRSEVEQFKIRKRDIIDRCLVGYTPIGSRPKPKYHYKFTKRDETLDVLYDGVKLRQLVENVKDLSGLDGKYRWIKYPRDSYYAVLGNFSGRMGIWYGVNNFQVLGVKVMLDE